VSDAWRDSDKQGPFVEIPVGYSLFDMEERLAALDKPFMQILSVAKERAALKPSEHVSVTDRAYELAKEAAVGTIPAEYAAFRAWLYDAHIPSTRNALLPGSSIDTDLAYCGLARQLVEPFGKALQRKLLRLRDDVQFLPAAVTNVRSGPRLNYRSGIKRVVLVELTKNPDASDREICRALDAEGSVELPKGWRSKPEDRLFFDAYSDSSRRHKVEVAISKVRRDMSKQGLLPNKR
jgi:hypothetical protein